MSGISEKEWKAALLSLLEELDRSEYAKMLEYLEKLPKSLKTGRSKEEKPQMIIQYYGLEESISAISDAMEQIPRRDPTVQDLLRPFVEKLSKEHERDTKGKKRKRDPEKEKKRPAAETTSKLATDSGSVAERQKPAAGKKRKRDPEEEKKRPAADQQKNCRPDEDRNSHPSRKRITDLNSSCQLLPTDFIIGKAVLKSGLRTYQTKEKVKKDFFYLALADETASIKLMVYGKKHYREIKEENFYMFRKLMKDEKGIKVTALSNVSQTSSVEVPEKLEMEARKLIDPESPVCSIAEAKLSVDKTGVNVQGTVKEIDPVEPVEVKDKRKKTKLQKFQLEDETDSISICMWGEGTKQCKGISVGDVIKVTNLKTSQYHETASLNSTQFTSIHKVQSVGIQNVKIEIMGIKKATKRETHLEANVNQQVHTLVVASRLLAEAFGFKLDVGFKQSLLDKMPLSADAVIQGGKIIKITAT